MLGTESAGKLHARVDRLERNSCIHARQRNSPVSDELFALAGVASASVSPSFGAQTRTTSGHCNARGAQLTAERLLVPVANPRPSQRANRSVAHAQLSNPTGKLEPNLAGC